MSTLIFLLTVVSTIILLVTMTVRVFQRKPMLKIARWSIGIFMAYCLVWGCFWLLRRRPVVPWGTDICFDDWCATISNVKQLSFTSHDSVAYIVVVTMSNHARGIAQRPSEPRIHLIDDQARTWPPVALGVVPLDARLELHESKTTIMNFVVPKDMKRKRTSKN